MQPMIALYLWLLAGQLENWKWYQFTRLMIKSTAGQMCAPAVSYGILSRSKRLSMFQFRRDIVRSTAPNKVDRVHKKHEYSYTTYWVSNCEPYVVTASSAQVDHRNLPRLVPSKTYLYATKYIKTTVSLPWSYLHRID